MLLDQIHNSTWKAITRLHGKDINLRTPRSLLAHQSIALHFAQFPQFCFYAWLENAVLKRPSHSMGIKDFCPSRHPHTSIYLRRSAWSYSTFGTSAGRAFHIKPLPQNSLFPVHQGYRRKAHLAVMATLDSYYMFHSPWKTTFLP